MQLNHYNSTFNKRQFPIQLICENVTNAPNIGSIFRTADAFGISKLVFSGIETAFGRKMTKTSRATEKVVPYENSEDLYAYVLQLKTEGYRVIALEITSQSQDISLLKIESAQPIALIVGDENFGVSEALLSLVDTVYHIEMFGQNSSMNVVQATSIALYEITKQLRQYS